MRFDAYLKDNFDLKSRTYAARLISLGKVKIDGEICSKASKEIDDGFDKARIDIFEDKFCSQGGIKLEKALNDFKIDVKGLSAVDIGCSNGGFTDCLLKRGVKSVLSVDVGECALQDDILSDTRVTFLRTNAREISGFPVADGKTMTYDFVCGDVSFISLTLILPTVFGLLKPNGSAALLIKPQFELTKKDLTKSGIVKNEKLRQSALEKVKNFAMVLGFTVKGITQIPLVYEDKNVEYLLHLTK